MTGAELSRSEQTVYISPVLFSEGVLVMRLVVTSLFVAMSFVPYVMVQVPLVLVAAEKTL
jgi:hypothetical protein